MKKNIYFLLIAISFIFTAQNVLAEWNPGAAKAAPAGTSGMLTYFDHYTGNEKYSNGKKVSNNENFEMDVTIFRPITWIEKGRFLIAPQILQPVGSKTYSTTYSGDTKIDLDQNDSGIGDTIFAIGFWPIHDFKKETFFLFQFYLTAPTGDYDSDKIINMGENRWKYRLESGMSKKIAKNLAIEFGGGITFYGDNDEYRPSKTTLEQDFSYSAQCALLYDITKGHTISVVGYYNHYGETTIGGIDQANANDTYAAQIGFGWALSKTSQLFIKYKKDLSVDEGLEKDVMGVRWAYFF